MKMPKNYLSFFCYISIFALMLLFEAERFSAYFQRESNKVPQLAYLGELLHELGQKSGLNALMDNISTNNAELSPKIIIDNESSYLSQFTEIADYYTQYFLSPNNSDHEIQNKWQSSTKLAQKDELSHENEFSGEIKINPQEIIIPKKIVSKEENLSENTALEQEIFTFYNPKNILPPPTENSLEIYQTLLPDFGKKIKVLIVGDSMMMEGLGPSLQSMLRKRQNLEVIRHGRYSSGLSRPDFYNWNVNLQRLILEHNPELIVVSLGANDTQDIVNRKRFGIDTASWEKVYSIRAMNFLNLAVENNRKVIWISLPVMIKMPYANRTKLINKLQAEVCTYFENASYINIEHLLTEDGKFINFIKGEDNQTVRLRSKDNIHVTRAGGDILANHALPYLDKAFTEIQNSEVNSQPFIPVAGKANRVQFTSEQRGKKVEYYVYLPKIKDFSLAQIKNIQDLAKKDFTTQELLSKGFDGKKFPSLYLLHGAYDNADVWNEQLGQELQKIADEKQIMIICPSSEEFGWYLDSPKITSNQIESFMIKELIPHIDQIYPSSKKRAIAGLSMGGHGAMLLGLKYPKLFSSMASISGVLDLRLHQEQWKIKDLLGAYPDNEKLWNNNSVNFQVENKKNQKISSQIIISTGTEDLLVLEDNRQAKALLEKHKYNFSYQEHQGNHDWKFWQKYLPNMLREQADFLLLTQ